MGGGNVVINLVWKPVVVVVYYWFHRIHHEVRVFWASHVVHHSSEHYNLSTALRQTWTPMTALPFWAPLALVGFAPWMILT
jgi:sterol desaturase/sphingolipid hydroxylase (fatty acid hydroxylase superfamily)